MSVEKNVRKLQAALDRGNAQAFFAAMQKLGFGEMLRALPTYRRKINPDALGTNPHNLATLDALVLPDGAKAHSILRATVRAGGVTGELAPQAYGATPTTGQIAVAPNGNIVFLASDAITDVDVVYMPEKGDVEEIELPVASNALVLPTHITARGAVLLLEAEVTAGTATGKKIVLVPGTGPAAGQARINVAKTQVLFNATDAATRARVKLLVASKIDVDAVLEDESTGIF